MTEKAREILACKKCGRGKAGTLVNACPSCGAANIGIGSLAAALTAAYEEGRAEVARMREALETFEARTKALPLGHESRTKGASSYNWRMACLREIRELAALTASPVSPGQPLSNPQQLGTCKPALQVALCPLEEWHEDKGDVLWWKFPITEPPYVGSPLDLGHQVEITVRAHGVDKLMRVNIGGWPGYHTHFTPLPQVTAYDNADQKP